MSDGSDMVWPPYGGPVEQAALWVPQRLYGWQCEVLRATMQAGARVAVKTPNGSGKTSIVMPALGLSFMAAFPGAEVRSTAGVERQIKDNLWPVLRSALARYPRWRITDDPMRIQAPSVGGLPPAQWHAFTSRDPELVQGAHEREYRAPDGSRVYAPLMVIIDEAAFCQAGVLELLRMRCRPDVMVVASTPGEDAGEFYDCFGINRGKPWKTWEIGIDQCPHLKTGWKWAEIEQDVERLGRDNPLVRSSIFGEFYHQEGVRRLFDGDLMRDVEACMGAEVPTIRGRRRAALDYSGGGDEQVIVVSDGNAVVRLDAYRERDTIGVAEKFRRTLAQYEVDAGNVTADEGGLGQVINDYLERNGYRGIRRYRGNQAARDERKYTNRAAEDHFHLRWLILQHALRLPRDDRLREQLRVRNYEIRADDSNRIRMEAKERVRDHGGESPDRLDALVMLFSDLAVGEMPATEDGSSRGRRCPSISEAMRIDTGEGAHGVRFWWR